MKHHIVCIVSQVKEEDNDSTEEEHTMVLYNE